MAKLSPKGDTAGARAVQEALFLLLHGHGLPGGGGQLYRAGSAARWWWGNGRRCVGGETGAGIEGSDRGSSHLCQEEEEDDEMTGSNQSLRKKSVKKCQKFGATKIFLKSGPNENQENVGPTSPGA